MLPEAGIGISSGLQQQTRQGRAEGVREQAQAIARNLLRAGLPAEMIAQNTGLTLAEVQELGRP